MRRHVAQNGVAWGYTDQYIIADGTRTGECLTVWSPATAEEAFAFATTMRGIKSTAWQEHYGVTMTAQSLDEARQEVERHFSRNGSFQLAWFGELAVTSAKVVGWVKHRPIYTELVKREMRSKPEQRMRPLPVRAYVHNIDVLPDVQDSGVGTAMLDAALSYYPSWVELMLEATGEMGYTHRWFEGMGLQPNRDIQIDSVLGLAQLRYDGATVNRIRTYLARKLKAI